MKVIIPLLLFVSTLSCSVHQKMIEKNKQNQVEKRIQVKKGESFHIQFLSSYGNGYEWELINTPKQVFVQLDSVNFIRKENQESLSVQNEVKKFFYFKAQRPGTQKLRFVQVRPWEREQPLRTEEYEIVIKN